MQESMIHTLCLAKIKIMSDKMQKKVAFCPTLCYYIGGGSLPEREVKIYGKD